MENQIGIGSASPSEPGNHRRSGSGAATNTGISFQQDCTAYFAVHMLADGRVPPPFDLPPDVSLVALFSETPASVDDLQMVTSAGGRLLLQAKTTVTCSSLPDSDLAGVVAQWVRQAKDGIVVDGQRRVLDSKFDRLVLAVGPNCPATVKIELRAAVQRTRDVDASSLDLVRGGMSIAVHRVFDVIVSHISLAWHTVFGLVPSPAELLCLLRLVHVEALSFAGEGAQTFAQHVLRTSVLERPTDSGKAWDFLVAKCRSYACMRSGADARLLREALAAAGFALLGRPSYDASVAALRKESTRFLATLAKRGQLAVGDRRITIPRAAIQALQQLSRDGNTIVTGSPGIGKSGLLSAFIDIARSGGAEVLALGVERHRAETRLDLDRELGLAEGQSISDVLQNWPGEGAAFLVLDGLDAARARPWFSVLQELVAEVSRVAPRWRVIVTMRDFDLSHNLSFLGPFSGSPANAYSDPRFSRTRHIAVGELTDDELSRVENDAPELAGLLADGCGELGTLARNPFNLQLLCQLLGDAELRPRLIDARTQVGLLGLLWASRVVEPRNERESPGGRKRLVDSVVKTMVEDRALSTGEETIGVGLLHELDGLRSDGMLVGDEGRIAFSHNIVFDYAVARSWLRDLDDKILAQLAESPNHDLLLVLRPSLIMALSRLWERDVSRSLFWARGLAVHACRGMPLVGRIIPSTVAAQNFRVVDDVAPLLERIRGGLDDGVGAQALLYVVLAAAAFSDGGSEASDLVGEDSPEWMRLADVLAGERLETTWPHVLALVREAVKAVGKATPEQLHDLNAGGRKLLSLAIQTASHSHVVRPAIKAVCSSFAVAPSDSAEALAPLLAQEGIKRWGHESLLEMAPHVPEIALSNMAFCEHLVSVVMGADGDRDETVNGLGKIIRATFNKRDMFETARHELAAAFPRLVESDLVAAARVLMVVLTAEGESKSSGPRVCFELNIAGVVATVWEDGSHWWMDQSFMEHEAFHKAATAFTRGLASLGAGKAEHVRRVLKELGLRNTPAGLWRILLSLGAKEPGSLGVELAEALSSPALLRCRDTCSAAGDLLAVVHGLLPIEARLRIERAILDTAGPEIGPSHPLGLRTRDWLLTQIPPDAIKGDEAKKVLATLQGRGAASAPPGIGIESFRSGLISQEELMRFEGVDLESAEHRSIQALTASVSRLQAAVTEGNVNEGGMLQGVSNLQALERMVREAPALGVDARLAHEGSRIFSDFCLDVAKRQGTNMLREFARAAFLRAATHVDPAWTPEMDVDWGNKAGEWSPGPRTFAAEGLRLIALSGDLDHEVAEAVRQLAHDPVPAVRSVAAYSVGQLLIRHTDLGKQLLDHYLQHEELHGVTERLVDGILQTPCHAGHDAGILRLYRVARRSAHGDSVRSRCVIHFLRRWLHQGDSRFGRKLRALTLVPHACRTELDTVVRQCRGLIACRDPLSADAGLTVGDWSVDYLRRVLLQELRQLRSLMWQAKTGPLSQEEATQAQRHFDMVNKIVNAAYFGTNAQSARAAKADAPTREDIEARSKLFAQVEPLLRALVRPGICVVAYHALQTFDYFSHAAPRPCIRMAAKLVRNTKADGFEHEYLAADCCIKMVGRYLAEHRDLLQESATRRSMIDLLDIFVEVGWPEALKLTFRVHEAWR